MNSTTQIYGATVNDLGKIQDFLGETSPHEIWDYVSLIEYYDLVWI